MDGDDGRVRSELEELLLSGSESLQQRRMELLNASGQSLSWPMRWRIGLKILGIVVLLVMGLFISVVSGLVFIPHSRWHRSIISGWHSGLCLVLGIKVCVHGVAAEAETSLWISNHVSWLDIPVLGSLFSVYFLAKAEVSGWPLLGYLARISGTLFIKRGSGDSGKVAHTLSEHLKMGRKILFFPEGTTTDGRQLKRFFHRLFNAAVFAECPIQPILICYKDGEDLNPWVPFIGDDELLNHAKRVLALRTVHVDVFVLPLQHRNGAGVRIWCKQIEEVMHHELQTILHTVPKRVL